MKPPSFSYHDPQTPEAAVALLASLDNAKVLAGGQSLMPMLNMRFVLPDHVIDLNGIAALTGLSREGSCLKIGAMVRQRELEFSDLVAADCPLMREALTHVGHRQTRNRGTIGGSLCHLDPAAELPVVALVHDASLDVLGPEGVRQIAFADFPLGYMTPAIGPDELLVRITVPLWPARHGFAFEEFARRHGDFAQAAAAVLMCLDEAGAIARIAVALGGVAEMPLRLSAAEDILLGQMPSYELFRKAADACRDFDALGDVHAPADYRRHLASVMTRRALTKAAARAKGLALVVEGGAHV
jgi:carbon-monoxide dehydrogenase medium subunit